MFENWEQFIKTSISETSIQFREKTMTNFLFLDSYRNLYTIISITTGKQEYGNNLLLDKS